MVREPLWIGLVALSLVVFAIGLVAVVALNRLAYTGVFLNRSNTITEIDPATPNAASFQLGDQILEVGGIDITAPISLRRGRGVGDSLTYRVERAGETLDIEMRLVAPPRVAQVQRVITIVLALAFWCLGFFVFLRRPDDPGFRMFLLANLAVAVVLGTLDLAAVHEPWAAVVGYLALLLSPALFVHFHLYFPARVAVARGRSLMVTLYLTAALLFGAFLYSGLNGLPEQPWYPLHSVTFLLYLIGSYAIGLFLLISMWRRGDGRTRRRIRVIVVGTLVAVLPLMTIFIGEFFYEATVVRIQLTLLGLGAIPLAYAYALHRDDLVSSERRIHRVLIATLLALALLATAMAVQRLLGALFPSLAYSPIAASVAAVAVAIVITPLRGGIEVVVSRLLYGSAYSYLTVFSDAVEALGDLEPASLESVLTRRIPQVMGIDQATVWAVDKDQQRMYPLAGSDRLGEPASVERDRVWARLATGTPTVLRAADVAWPGAARWLVPLRLADEVVGLWALGPRSNDESLSPVDLRLIDLTARTASLVVKVATLLHEARVKLAESEAMQAEIQRAYSRLTVAEETERRRLALELHDDVLQSVYALEMAIRQATRRSPALLDGGLGDRVRDQVGEIITRIRQVCSGLYPPLLDTMGLAASLSLFADDLSEQYGIAVHLDISTERHARPVEAALYRIAQEALTNVARHAQVAKASVQVVASGKQIALSVRDGGVGFDPSAVSGRRFGLMGMTARATELGGTLTIESREGVGTSLVVTIPLKESHF